MNKVWAIAMIALRSAVRSKIVICLILLLLITIIGIPLTVKGDGSPESKVQVLVSYTLAFSQIILAIVTLWSGCAAVSTEVEDSRIHLVVTKPVHRAQIWLGKWLGLLLMNFVALLLTGLTVYGLLKYETRESAWKPDEYARLQEEVLVARRVVPAPVPNVEKAATRQLRDLITRGQLAPGMSPEATLGELRQRMLIQTNAVEYGATKSWTITLPMRPPPDRKIFLQYKYQLGSLIQEPVNGIWILGNHEEERQIMIPLQQGPGTHSLAVPETMIGEDLEIIVTYANTHPHPTTVLFDTKEGVQILYWQDSFATNLCRTLLIQFFQLALYAALGLTMGTLFSMPVAAFTSIFIIILQLFSGFIETITQESIADGSSNDPAEALSMLEHLMVWIYKSVHFLLKPLSTNNPLELLASGVVVSWEIVTAEFFVKIICYTGLIGGIGVLLFNRRELGIPS
ncbi:MAG: hypothetical protein ACI9TH_002166 [Kiritimatiellia bacterium]|jgi:hypothetical protein